MKKSTVDLSDLFVTKDEALDILGDLIPQSSTNLFGEVKKIEPKPRPKWQLDGFTILRKERKCTNCGAFHVDTNQYILVSESLVDADGNVLRNHKTANPNTLRQKDIDYESLDIRITYVSAEPVNFCGQCSTSKERVYSAFFAQQKAMLRKDPDEQAAAEQALLDILKDLED